MSMSSSSSEEDPEVPDVGDEAEEGPKPQEAPRPPKPAKAPEAAKPAKPAKPAKAPEAKVREGEHVRFVLVKPDGVSVCRLALVTRVAGRKLDLIVYPAPGDFQKQIDPGPILSVRGVGYSPLSEGVVVGTWHRSEEE